MNLLSNSVAAQLIAKESGNATILDGAGGTIIHKYKHLQGVNG